ncbi:tyrosine-type recombinase/integrase [Pseudoalteromonas obscura]|uniref:Tyrosine-type recombinase/integrase n=1 Tax=Pseudoalteromonas obscura TaxID=3048491 RepID=A0ABT7EGR8_9GAMM|nr:tyrosine-type recombinase/integrase [Pseudoalteromonas sp. P94(2023)]MDK2594231.1 tyrosine-type recombinase/integrase [Pseudoalteromonas sp. P94(2023)]
MSPRRRKSRNSDLPAHLYHETGKGFRFKLINGERVSLGHNRAEAIAIAQEYNLRMLGGNSFGIEALITRSAPKQENFSAYLDKIQERIIDEEKPSHDTKKTLMNDIGRAKEFFTNIHPEDIELTHVNEYLYTYHDGASNHVTNRKISFLGKIFSYAMDEGLMTDNPAKLKKKKPKEDKQRVRLTPDDFKRIYAAAPLNIKVAMDLALQTTHAALEISRIEYKLSKPMPGRCGCVWLKEPVMQNGGKVYGTLYIHRQKIKNKEAAHVAIPIGQAIKDIIDISKKDLFFSPYVVHKRATNYNIVSQECTHATQFNPSYLSKKFSEIRDNIGQYKHLPKTKRPTFHEIRALSAFLYSQNGVDPQARMAHTDAKSTKVYTQNHRDWVEVPLAEIVV